MGDMKKYAIKMWDMVLKWLGTTDLKSYGVEGMVAVIAINLTIVFVEIVNFDPIHYLHTFALPYPLPLP